mmetsp:Transcript_13294/g.56167  ORF Transcript_13294/g.56167 Transcript_13294/m.56167 type:complete len:231 (+) Transcript_13294:223-915(+)
MLRCRLARAVRRRTQGDDGREDRAGIARPRGVAHRPRSLHPRGGEDRRRRDGRPDAVPHQRRSLRARRHQRRVDPHAHRHRQEARHLRRRIPHLTRRGGVQEGARGGGRRSGRSRPHPPLHLLPRRPVRIRVHGAGRNRRDGRLGRRPHRRVQRLRRRRRQRRSLHPRRRVQKRPRHRRGRALPLRRLARPRDVHPLRRRVRRHGADVDAGPVRLLPLRVRHALRRRGEP